MKKVLIGIVSLALVAVLGAYLFRGQLKETAVEAMVADMFLEADTDSYDPGLAIGDTFPALKVNHEGKIISDMGQFISDKGMIFIANRSVDW